jgi:hypothetical protein
MKIVKVEDTETIQMIARALNTPSIHTLRVSVNDGGVKFKINGGVWTPPLGKVEVDD